MPEFTTIMAIVASVSAIVLPYLGLRIAFKKDKAAAQNTNASTVIGGQDTLIDNLREDIDRLRTELREERADYAELRKMYQELSTRCDRINYELEDLKRKYGEFTVT